MTFEELKKEVYRGVVRDDMDYGQFVNEAIDLICQDRDWTFMRQKSDVTLLGTQGNRTVNFPDNFKKLTPERVPIFQVNNDGTMTPCVIYTREKLEDLYSAFGALVEATTGRDRRLSVFVDSQDNQWVVGTATPPASDIVFRISFFQYFPHLAQSQDRNVLTDTYPRMVIERAKGIAFGSINDPEEVQAFTRFQTYFDRASRTDMSIEIAARKKRG